jgi:DNA-binding transcriptional ArsR family regulator
MIHGLADVLALDENVLARQLAAIASPLRLRIVRELAARPLQTHELQARLGEPSAGQLYHHLRELLAAGLVTQPRRSVYEVPARVVIPLFTLIACAHDLTTARDEKDLQ